MTTKNDITGDSLINKPANDKFRDNFDRIFGTKTVPYGEDTRPKDRWKLGLSPSTVVEEISSEDLK